MILAKNLEHLDFDQNFHKMSILVKIFGTTKFWVHFSKNLYFGEKNEILMQVIDVEIS